MVSSEVAGCCHLDARPVKRETKDDGLLLTQFREGYNFQDAVVTRGLTARQARAPVSGKEHDSKRRPAEGIWSSWQLDFLSTHARLDDRLQQAKDAFFYFIPTKRNAERARAPTQ